MLACPAAITAMPLADRLASCTIHGSAAARIVARGALRCERLARGFDRAEAGLAAHLGHARIAVPASALEHRFAAQRARDPRGRARFDCWRAPCSRRVGRGCEALRRVASSGDRSGPGTLRRLFAALAIMVRGVAPLLTSNSRKTCARRAAIGRGIAFLPTLKRVEDLLVQVYGPDWLPALEAAAARGRKH
jgi:hypothetical protein